MFQWQKLQHEEANDDDDDLWISSIVLGKETSHEGIGQDQDKFEEHNWEVVMLIKVLSLPELEKISIKFDDRNQEAIMLIKLSIIDGQ